MNISNISNLTLDEIERLLYISNNPCHSLFVKIQDEITDELLYEYEGKTADAYDDGYKAGYDAKELELEKE
jgi:hypothetical protein